MKTIILTYVLKSDEKVRQKRVTKKSDEKSDEKVRQYW